MATIEQTHERHNHTIKDLNTGKREVFPSIAKAKRASRALQQANGGLGRGSLRVVK